jgi:hypothetical protein
LCQFYFTQVCGGEVGFDANMECVL